MKEQDLEKIKEQCLRLKPVDHLFELVDNKTEEEPYPYLRIELEFPGKMHVSITKELVDHDGVGPDEETVFSVYHDGELFIADYLPWEELLARLEEAVSA